MHRKVGIVALLVGTVLLLGFTTGRASAQQCPVTSATGAPSQNRTLSGKLVYHDGIRKWFELKLDKPACGEHSIQLIATDDNLRSLEAYRGCHVSSTDKIDYSPTGYYSLELYQAPRQLRPIGSCARKSPIPILPKTVPDVHVRSYTVNMHVDYRPGDHPIEFRVTSGGRELRPWQTYAGYQLTGAYVLYGFCGDGFAVDRIFGTAAAHPSHFTERGASDDMAMFDPESAAASGKADLNLGYTCLRESRKH